MLLCHVRSQYCLLNVRLFDDEAVWVDLVLGLTSLNDLLLPLTRISGENADGARFLEKILSHLFDRPG